MTIKKLILILMAVVVSVIVGYLLLHRTYYEKTNSIAPTTATKSTKDLSAIKGYAIVEVSPEGQTLGGISTTALQSANWVDGIQAQVSVIDLSSYFSLIMQRESAHEDLKAMDAELKVARLALHRIQVLYDDGRNASEQNLQEAQSRLVQLQAKQAAQIVKLNALSMDLSTRFGHALASLPSTKPLEFNQLKAGRAVILRAALPASSSIDTRQYTQLRLPDSHRTTTVFLSMASNVDPFTEGSASLFYFESELPSGFRMQGNLSPINQRSEAGVVVPPDAVVWYGGQPWVYLQIDPTHYERRPLPIDKSLKTGYFSAGNFKAGDMVVTRGAELLLSDEQRPPPNSVAGCKDPECDD